MLSAPHHLAELGYRVFPCVPGGKRPLTAHGLLDATSDADQIAAWQEQWPRANWAIRTDGLLVVDVDPLAEGANPWLADDYDRAADLAVAPISLTPRGGRHYLFRQPPESTLGNTASKLAAHVDTRADGGYIVVPPSVLDGGKTYRWAAGELDLQPGELPLPPEWLLAKLGDRVQGPKSKVQGSESANQIPSGQRNAALTSMAGYMRRGGHDAAEIFDLLAGVNSRRCNPPVEDAELRTIAQSVSRYEPDQVTTALNECWSQQDADASDAKAIDPGSFPPHLLAVPGFIGDVMAFNLAGAFKPQPVLALGAALTLLSALTGRKIRDEFGTRTNIYCLGVARTGGGKERARLINKEILFQSGLQKYVGPESVASSAGLVSAVEKQPAILFQWDEIGRLLKTMGDARGSPHLFHIGTVLMKLYSSAGTIYLSDAYADREKNKSINQPHCCLYGTTVPRSLYESLSAESITDGFLSRMLIFETDDHDPRGQSVPQLAIPDELLEVAMFWGEWKPAGNMAEETPEPRVVPYTPEAASLFIELDELAYQERRGAEEQVAALWTRTVEKARKLALLWACSQNHAEPAVDAAGARWACELSDYLTRKMIAISRAWVAENQQESKHQRLLRIIAAGTPPGVKANDLYRKTKFLTTREREELLEALRLASDITCETIETSGRPATIYRAL